MAEQHLPGLVVCTADGRPVHILPGTRVLRFPVPRSVRDDPALARVIDERTSERPLGELAGSTGNPDNVLCGRRRPAPTWAATPRSSARAPTW